jgi:rare lipoprotein A
MVRVASARSFVPDMPTPGRVARGDVPMPEGRPYSLGHTTADVASINATSEMSASNRVRPNSRMVENRRAVTYENDSRYAPPEQAVERAPADEARDILSGRGLY